VNGLKSAREGEAEARAIEQIIVLPAGYRIAQVTVAQREVPVQPFEYGSREYCVKVRSILTGVRQVFKHPKRLHKQCLEIFEHFWVSLSVLEAERLLHTLRQRARPASHI
jgi:hypothetical protein